MITTNQSMQAGNPLTATLRCHHQPGRATPDTCALLRSLSRLRAEVVRAEQLAERGDTTAQQITALWLLTAEASTSSTTVPIILRADSRRDAPVLRLRRAGRDV